MRHSPSIQAFSKVFWSQTVFFYLNILAAGKFRFQKTVQTLMKEELVVCKVGCESSGKGILTKSYCVFARLSWDVDWIWLEAC